MKNKIREILNSHRAKVFETAYGYYLEILKIDSPNPQEIALKLAKILGDPSEVHFLERKRHFLFLLVEISPQKIGLEKILTSHLPSQWPSVSGLLQVVKKKKNLFILQRLAESLSKSGEVLVQKKLFAEAEKVLSMALSYQVENPSIHFQLARIYLQKDFWNPQKGEEHLQAIQKLFPDNKRVLLELGNLYMEQERMKEAIQSLSQFITLCPADPEGYHLMGLAKMITEDTEEAKNCFLNAIKINKEYKEAFLPLARCYITLKNYDRARVMLKLYIERDRRNFLAFHLLAEVYLHLKQMKKAKKNFKRSLKLNPDNMSAYYQLGQIYETMGDRRKSSKIYKKYRQWKQIVDHYGGLKLTTDLPSEEEDDWDLDEESDIVEW